jgi:predicted nucleic acid-binding protein
VGIILDSSFIIAAERRGHTVREILEQVKAVQGEIEIGVSVVTIAELVHGAYRTKTQAQQRRRLEFIERLSSDVPVHPVTLAIARLAGRIEAQQQAIGGQFASEDLLIWNDSVASWLRGRNVKSPRLPENPRSFCDATLNWLVYKALAESPNDGLNSFPHAEKLAGGLKEEVFVQ